MNVLPDYIKSVLKEEDPRFKGLRKTLVNTLRQKNIRDPRVLEAMLHLPRHLFMPKGIENRAYEDKAFSIGHDQTISQPYTVAFQTQLLEIKAGENVLEIGTGSGYQAAILKCMGAVVYTIERQKALYDKLSTFELFQKLNIFSYYGDGYKGIPEKQPFDKILITAAAAEIPPILLGQLKVGGMMVIPLNNENKAHSQTMKRLTKIDAENKIKEEAFHDFQFVPMLRGTN